MKLVSLRLTSDIIAYQVQPGGFHLVLIAKTIWGDYSIHWERCVAIWIADNIIEE